jgi:hypothetical protein
MLRVIFWASSDSESVSIILSVVGHTLSAMCGAYSIYIWPLEWIQRVEHWSLASGYRFLLPSDSVTFLDPDSGVTGSVPSVLVIIGLVHYKKVTAASSDAILCLSLLIILDISLHGSWRKLHNDELHDLYFSPNIVRVIQSRRMRWAGHVARMGEGRGVYRVLVGRPEGKKPLGRPRRR